MRVSDRDAFAMARRITREEGILAGESCGTAMLAALAVARELTESGRGPGAVIVVIFPDSGRNYLSKLYNDEWMRANGLLASPGAVVRVRDVLEDRHHGEQIPDLVAGPHHGEGRGGDRAARGLRDQPDAGLGGRRGQRAGGARRIDLAREASWSVPTAIRGSWSAPSAR